MKKIIIMIIFFLFLIPKVNASVDSASSYVLMDSQTGRVLLSKNKDRPMLIASITKIMTAIIAIESNKMDDVVIVDESILKAYGSCIYISVGEEIKLRDLIYGLMLRSGNDAALMISNYIMKSEEAFVDKMNEKARKIGMKNTTFVNSSGLDNESLGNYSTSYDMALLMKYAINNKLFLKIVGTKNHIVKTNYKTYSWINKNKILGINNINGGKTGYTEQAGRTLVTASTNDELSFIVVTLLDSDDWNTHKTLHQYGYDNYISYKVLNKKKYNVFKDEYYNNLYIKNNRYLTLTKDETGLLVNKIELEKKKKYNNGDKVGVNKIYLNDNLVIEESIYVKKSEIVKDTIFSRIRKLFE